MLGLPMQKRSPCLTCQILLRDATRLADGMWKAFGERSQCCCFLVTWEKQEVQKKGQIPSPFLYLPILLAEPNWEPASTGEMQFSESQPQHQIEKNRADLKLRQRLNPQCIGGAEFFSPFICCSCFFCDFPVPIQMLFFLSVTPHWLVWIHCDNPFLYIYTLYVHTHYKYTLYIYTYIHTD